MTVENNDIIYKETVVMANQEEIKVPAAEEAQVPEIIQTVEDLQAKSATELNDELVAAKKELFNLRFQNATNQLENTSRIKEVRRNIARIQTVIATKAN